MDLTGFAALDLKGSAGSGAVGGPPGGPPLRRTGSKHSLPAPDSTASSPVRTPVAGAAALPAAVAQAVGAAATTGAAAAAAAAGGEAVGVSAEWFAKEGGEGPPPPRRDRLPPPREKERSVRCVRPGLAGGRGRAAGASGGPLPRQAPCIPPLIVF